MSQQTRKTLLRHKRDDLVRLCEANGIEADGTKKQLAQALLEWVGAFSFSRFYLFIVIC